MTFHDLYVSCQNIRLDSNVRIYNVYNGTWKVCKMEKALVEYGDNVIDYFHIINDRDIEVYFK